MLLDWDRFKSILKKEEKKVQLRLIRNNVDFLIDFLTQLSLELKGCQSTRETVEKFPQAGLVLTLASTHPYIGYTPHIATLVITCLLEYSKLNIEPNTTLQVNIPTEKSVLWCINRLRRFINVDREQTEQIERKDTQSLIKQISDLIDSKGNQLNAHQISNILETCLSLIHEKQSFHIIEKIVNCALEYSNLTLSDSLLSDEFIYQIIQNESMRACWSQTLKIKLLMHCNELLDIQVLSMIENYIKLPINSIAIHDQFMQNDCIQLLQISPDLSKQFISRLSDHIIQFHNWRLIKLGKYIHQCIRIPLFELFEHEINKATFHHVETHALYDIISNYVYGDGLSLDIPNRRNEAWLLSLSFTRYLWYCVYHLIQWTQKKNEPWTSQMEDILIYINWVIYPSMDNRESESLSYLRGWIQSNQGNNQLYDDIPKLWHNLLNSNDILIACFVTTIFFSIDHLHVDQQISLIQGVLAKPERKNSIHGNTKKMILLDYLIDIETHANLYPCLNFEMNYLKNYIVDNY